MRRTITLDEETIETIERIERTVPEAQGISAAIRHMARCYDSECQQSRRAGRDGDNSSRA
jgi:hypothetical protein